MCVHILWNKAAYVQVWWSWVISGWVKKRGRKALVDSKEVGFRKGGNSAELTVCISSNIKHFLSIMDIGRLRYIQIQNLAHTHTVISFFPFPFVNAKPQTTELWTFPSGTVQDISRLQWITVCLMKHWCKGTNSSASNSADSNRTAAHLEWEVASLRL